MLVSTKSLVWSTSSWSNERSFRELKLSAPELSLLILPICRESPVCKAEACAELFVIEINLVYNTFDSLQQDLLHSSVLVSQKIHLLQMQRRQRSLLWNQYLQELSPLFQKVDDSSQTSFIHQWEKKYIPVYVNGFILQPISL